MKEWKVNQLLYHRLTEEHSDDTRNFTTISDPDVVGEALRYFRAPIAASVYPGKSYAIAVIYARLLRDHFDEDFYEVLDDPDLLFGNDPYFVPYSENKTDYDKILEGLGDRPHSFNRALGGFYGALL